MLALCHHGIMNDDVCLEKEEASDSEIVLHSLSGKRWAMRDADPRLVGQLYQQGGVSDICARILATRGITMETLNQFLEPRLRDLLPDPDTLKDMPKARDRIIQAIKNKEKVAIYGDYDVDGATSSALMARFLKFFGLEVTIYIPDRIDEGYGPNVDAMASLCQTHDFIMTLDCGITSFEPAAKAKELGTDLVILDHHTAEITLPEAHAVVNPSRLDEDGSLAHLAAVGVGFLTIISVIKELKVQQYEGELPDARQWLDIVALGTVCDVMKLKGINRAFVAQGLKVMAKTQNSGLRALMDSVDIKGACTTFHAGFVLGPRINAAGRIGECDMGAKMLATDDVDEAIALAQTLNDNNRERQQMEREAVEEAMKMAEKQAEEDSYILLVAGKGWHPGIVGLIASRLMQTYNRPSCAITIDEDGKAKASGRSIDGIDLGGLVIAARQEGYLISGGGHAMAAGFTFDAEKLDDLRHYMTQRIIEKYGKMPLKPLVKVDAELTPQGANLTLCDELEQLAPFGNGNANPKFLMRDVRLKSVDILGNYHLRLIVGDSMGNGSIKMMGFGMADSPLGQSLLKSVGKRSLHLVATLRRNIWQGRESAEMTLEDAAYAD